MTFMYDWIENLPTQAVKISTDGYVDNSVLQKSWSFIVNSLANNEVNYKAVNRLKKTTTNHVLW